MEKSKKILITGARGMLGMALSKTLGSLFKASLLDKDDCDITDSAAVKYFFARREFDVIIHCAAYTAVDKAQDEPELAYLVNAQGVKNIFDATEGSNCLFIYLSTDYVFDGAKPAPYTEEDTPRPINVYGQTKLKGEQFARLFKRYLIIRTSWLFGPDGNNFVRTILKKASEKSVLDVVNDQVGSPTYTLHLALAIRKLLETFINKGVPCGVYNITNSGVCSWYTLACRIAALKKLPVEIRPIASEHCFRKAGRPKNSALSGEKFYALTGFRLPRWQEAVEDYLKNL
ncbi:MAG: dTDP-4-dehydrorhamnose reductase [Candidatus Omnitrophica bacterium]|nr:dTDP-4-dehydrorhamnose reductase [Candidatus Omnitrophota bacterium]